MYMYRTVLAMRRRFLLLLSTSSYLYFWTDFGARQTARGIASELEKMAKKCEQKMRRGRLHKESYYSTFVAICSVRPTETRNFGYGPGRAREES